MDNSSANKILTIPGQLRVRTASNKYIQGEGEITNKTGLQVAFTQTGIMFNNTNYKRKLTLVKNGKLKFIRQFKCLGGVISENGPEKEQLKSEKLKRLEYCARNTLNAKLRHYDAVLLCVIEGVNMIKVEKS